MIVVAAGYTASCAECSARCATWWRGADFYACVHEKCAPRLVERCPSLAGRAPAVAQGAVVRRGAYARHAGAAATAPPLFVPARFPGYINNVAWLAVAETSIGHVVVPCGGNAGHGVSVVRRWELLAAAHHPIGSGDVRAYGAALFTPEGEAALTWGLCPDVGSPVWEQLARVRDWCLCSGCSGYLWPGRWTTRAGLCWICGGDGRPWPAEPDFPGEDFVPDHMRDDVPKAGRRKRTPREFSRADHD